MVQGGATNRKIEKVIEADIKFAFTTLALHFAMINNINYEEEYIK